MQAGERGERLPCNAINKRENKKKSTLRAKDSCEDETRPPLVRLAVPITAFLAMT